MNQLTFLLLQLEIEWDAALEQCPELWDAVLDKANVALRKIDYSIDSFVVMLAPRDPHQALVAFLNYCFTDMIKFDEASHTMLMCYSRSEILDGRDFIFDGVLSGSKTNGLIVHEVAVGESLLHVEKKLAPQASLKYSKRPSIMGFPDEIDQHLNDAFMMAGYTAYGALEPIRTAVSTGVKIDGYEYSVVKQGVRQPHEGGLQLFRELTEVFSKIVKNEFPKDSATATVCDAADVFRSGKPLAWVKLKDDIEYLKTLKIVAFGGGPLSSKVGGELIAEGVNLYPCYGGTEFGPHTKVFDMDESSNPASGAKTKADWEWMSFSDRVTCRWVPEGNNTFELQYLTCATHRPNLENLEDTKGYATSDLWESHPSKKGLWRIIGRKDDVIVLGEKVVPIPQEGVIGSSRMVQGVVMFGRGKSQCGILVEPKKGHAVNPNDVNALPEFRNKLWPIVEEANRTAPAFARIFKEMIIVTERARPLPRTAKGTIIRKQALKTYEKEINNLYAMLEDSGISESIRPPSSWTVPDIQAWLLEHISVISNGRDVISPSKELFDQGFDSLHATFLRTRIINALRADPQTNIFALHVSQNFVFEHPTLHGLAIAISVLIGEDIHEDVQNH
ncbi:uncharacterized protein PHACADRAFT_213657 [Phanerochaete carnosa HHB-10118-sp]|uniref:Polyketide synthase-like phosphopantetheine-binding domain-containing protein n=2 Tax=Phanerochaete carnosa (strain HHB-10118-sp) TaxID=650164 RepID=K5VW21_PHACS|nr:uncharacterized protein PHACADRAFT_213657 [Phanerochaete carnosa HHB-10118-sp]EKM50779.1 hypothetical protein PHACADRAFT_213657 [Phanerochaete carnosa HHB-10118-sp]